MCNGSRCRPPEIPSELHASPPRFPFDVICTADGWFYLRCTASPTILCSSRDPRVIATHYRDALTRWLDENASA